MLSDFKAAKQRLEDIDKSAQDCLKGSKVFQFSHDDVKIALKEASDTQVRLVAFVSTMQLAMGGKRK